MVDPGPFSEPRFKNRIDAYSMRSALASRRRQFGGQADAGLQTP
jgi:hypothetical protein